MQQSLQTHQNSYNEKHNIPSFNSIHSNLDSHMLLVGVKNGCINLKTGGQDLIKLHIYQLYDKTRKYIYMSTKRPLKQSSKHHYL